MATRAVSFVDDDEIMLRSLNHTGNDPGPDDTPVTMTRPDCEAQHIASTSCLAVTDAANRRFPYTGSTEQIVNVLKNRKCNQDNEHEC